MGRLGYYSKLSGQAVQESDPPPKKKQILMTALFVKPWFWRTKKNPPLYAISQL